MLWAGSASPLTSTETNTINTTHITDSQHVELSSTNGLMPTNSIKTLTLQAGSESRMQWHPHLNSLNNSTQSMMLSLNVPYSGIVTSVYRYKSGKKLRNSSTKITSIANNLHKKSNSGTLSSHNKLKKKVKSFPLAQLLHR